MDNFTTRYLSESIELIRALDPSTIEAMADGLAAVRAGEDACSSSASAEAPDTPGTR